MYAKHYTLISTTCSMSSAKKAKLSPPDDDRGGGASAPGTGLPSAAPPPATTVYHTDAQIISDLIKSVRTVPQSKKLTVFLVSFGKFRVVTKGGHTSVWEQLASTASAILRTPALAGRVEVCIEISSSLSPPCPPTGSMLYVSPPISADASGSKKLANTLKAKDQYCSKPIDDINRTGDIAARFRSILTEKGILPDPNLFAVVSATPGRPISAKEWEGLPPNAKPYYINVKDGRIHSIPRTDGFRFNVLYPQFASQPCAGKKEKCSQPGSQTECLVIFFGGSDRVGSETEEDIKDKFMSGSPVPHALFRVGEERESLEEKAALLLRLVRWALSDGAKPHQIGPAAFSSSFVDYVTEMCIWACIPRRYLEKILQEVTVHSLPTIQSIIDVKADQLASRIRNVLELKRHAVALGTRLESTPLPASDREKKKAIKGVQTEYTTADDVMQHMSHKMVDDARMLGALAHHGIQPYSRFLDGTPSKKDFELLLGWKGASSKWWRENPADLSVPEGPSQQETYADEAAKTVGEIRGSLAEAGKEPVCTLLGLAGGRRTRRKRNTRKKRRQRNAKKTRRNRRGINTRRRVVPREKRR